jgi:hypothetical protein
MLTFETLNVAANSIVLRIVMLDIAYFKPK